MAPAGTLTLSSRSGGSFSSSSVCTSRRAKRAAGSKEKPSPTSWLKARDGMPRRVPSKVALTVPE
jgi:hypothetical protein